MKNSYTLTILLMFVYMNMYPQNYNSGYIIDSKKDTIHGFILDQIDEEMGLKIEFKNDLSDLSSELYYSSDIHEFGFDNGRVFEQQNSIVGTNDTLKVFAKRIIQGRINMYIRRIHGIKEEELFLRNNYLNKVVQIKKPIKEIKANKDGTKYAFEDNRFIGLLNYITSDVPEFKLNSKLRKYSSKKISGEIKRYNNLFTEEFPTDYYQEQKTYSYVVMGGIPIIMSGNGNTRNSAFRFAFYMNKNFPEKNRKLSFISGISYRYGSWENEYESNSSQHFLSMIPLGLNFHGSKGTVRPYAYFGLGLTMLRQPVYMLDSNQELESIVQRYSILPGLGVGVGVKIKVRSNFINIEFTPTGNYSGIFMNIGFTF